MWDGGLPRQRLPDAWRLKTSGLRLADGNKLTWMEPSEPAEWSKTTCESKHSKPAESCPSSRADLKHFLLLAWKMLFFSSLALRFAIFWQICIFFCQNWFRNTVSQKKNNNVGGMKQKKKQSIKEKMTKGHFVTWQQLFISQLYFFYWRMFCCFLFINSESKVSLSTNLKIAKLGVTPKNTNIHFCWMSFGHSKEMCT